MARFLRILTPREECIRKGDTKRGGCFTQSPFATSRDRVKCMLDFHNRRVVGAWRLRRVEMCVRLVVRGGGIGEWWVVVGTTLMMVQRW